MYSEMSTMRLTRAGLDDVGKVCSRHTNCCNASGRCSNWQIMNLHNLDYKQLKDLFLEINGKYLQVIDAPIASYINSPEFLEIRNELHKVLTELDKRRQNDPFIVHDHSAHGLESDQIKESSFLSDME